MNDKFLRRWTSRARVALSSMAKTDWADEADLYFCYRLLLGREPDDQGWRDWSLQLREGRKRDHLVNAFLTSSEFRNRQRAIQTARVDTGGFVMYVDSGDPYIGGPIARDKTYEPHVTSLIRELLDDRRVFLDIGANMGWYTLMAAAILKDRGQVIAVEPNPYNVQLLYQSIVANRLTNVKVLPYAASDVPGLLRLTTLYSNSSVTPIPAGSEDCEYAQAVRLDDLIGSETRVDVIKIDVEGHELFALRGMQRLIQAHHPVIVSEFNPKALREFSATDPADYLRALKDSGYSLSVIEHDGNVLSLNEEAKILDYWQELNRRFSATDAYFLDILAQPG